MKAHGSVNNFICLRIYAEFSIVYSARAMQKWFTVRKC